MKRRHHLLAGLLLLVLAPPSRGQASKPLPTELRSAVDEIERLAALELAKEPVGSVTIGIVSGAELLWTRSFGYADMEARVLATKDSVYRIGSITKQFTALMLLQLAESGKLRPSDPVEKYFPEIRRAQGRTPGAAPISLVQLATMTSGLAREPEDLPTYLKGSVSEWEKVLISALPKVRFRYPPDTHYHYSNVGYAILGAALARAAGQSYVEYMREHVLQPLGMDHTAFEPNPAVEEHIAKGYAIRTDGAIDDERPAREHGGRGYKVPNGALYTTVGDLAKFVAFELGEGPEAVLKKETLEDNFARVNSASGDLREGYGVGFRVFRDGELVFYGHGGSVAGYRASTLLERTSKTGIVVLRNVGGRFSVSTLARKALKALVGAKEALKAP